MPVKQNEQAAGNGGRDAVSAEYLNIPFSEIVIDAQIRSEIDVEDESFQPLKAYIRDWNMMAPIILMRMEKGAACCGVVDVIPRLTRNPVSFPGFPLSRE